MPKNTTPEILFRSFLETPIGTMLVVTDVRGRINALDWTDYEDRMRRLLQVRARREGKEFEIKAGILPTVVRKALDAYFDGIFAPMENISVYTVGTEFQQAVWQELREIPIGITLSYSALAKKIGRPNAVRAVGAANGANPVGIVVPCHRVIGTNGSMTGYGGGLERKHWLLAHEGAIAGRRAPPWPLKITGMS